MPQMSIGEMETSVQWLRKLSRHPYLTDAMQREVTVAADRFEVAVDRLRRLLPDGGEGG